MERNCVVAPTAQAFGTDDPKGPIFEDNKSPMLPGPWGLGAQEAFLPARPSLIFLHRRSPIGPWPGKQTAVDCPPEFFFLWPPRCPGFLASSSPAH